MLMLGLLAALSAFAPDVVQAQGRHPDVRGYVTPSTPSPSYAIDGGFSTLMLVTNDYEAFWAEWQRPVPKVPTTKTVTRDRPVFAMILFTGCAAGGNGRCHLDVEFKMTGPDGKPYSQVTSTSAWRLPPAEPDRLLLSEATLGFNLDPGDKVGPYRIQATVTDRISGKVLKVEQVVNAVDKT